MAQCERHRPSYVGESRDDEDVNSCDLVDDAVMGAVCSHSLRGCLLLDRITQEDILDVPRGETGMLDKVRRCRLLSSKMATKGITGM